MSSIIHLLVASILVGCGTKSGDVQDIQVESGTQPVPPQPVIGSYLAAAFETPDTVNRNACSFSFHEGKDVFTAAL